jgi:sugar O-acyltransferase (sialic acid O-acetyltransferase NeuD family)
MSEAASPIGQILVPLINTNEPESQVVEIAIDGYSPVSRGDVVCTLETSKSAVDVESEYDGYLGRLHIRLHERVTAGQLICEVFDVLPERAAADEAAAAPAPGGARLTKKAEKLALETGLDLSSLPAGGFLTEADVRALIERSAGGVTIDGAVLAAIDADAVVVFGAGGFAKSAIDLISTAGLYRPICVVDDSPRAPADVLGVPVVGGRAHLALLREHGLAGAVNAVGALGRMQTRIDVFAHLAELGFALPTLVDPRSAVADSASLADGAQVFSGAQVCPAATVGKGTIVNTNAVVSHDCTVGDFVHLAPGCLLAGEVTVGDGTLVGMGVTTPVGLRIGAGAVVGNGAVLLADVPDGAIISAGAVWKG